MSDALAEVRALLAAATGDLDEPALRALAEAVGRRLPHGAVVTLEGSLGAGKTTFAQGLAVGLGVTNTAEVTSPTYALVHEYPTGTGTVVHADLYRLASSDALDALGWDELLAVARAVIIEWPAVAEARLPPGRLRVRIDASLAVADRRRVTLAA